MIALKQGHAVLCEIKKHAWFCDSDYSVTFVTQITYPLTSVLKSNAKLKILLCFRKSFPDEQPVESSSSGSM